MSMGVKREDLGDGSSLLTMPYDEGLVRKSVTKDLEDRTRTPDPDTERTQAAGDDAGPIRRFNDVFTDVGSTYLEALGMDGFEIAKAIQTRRDELFRNEFPLVVKRFEYKCTVCGAEYDEEVAYCSDCKKDEFRTPDTSEKREAKQLFESVNLEGQSLRELWKMLEDDHGRLGVVTLIVKYDYTVATGDATALGQPIMEEGEVVRKEVDELVRGDPKRIVPVTDEDGRVGGWKWTCPLHREEAIQDTPGSCGCGAELREVHYVEKDHVRSSDATKYYFQDEVLSYADFFPRQHGLDGLSPVHHVWLKQAILHWMDVYAGAFFDPNSNRYPNKFMVVHTTNADAWERNFEKSQDNAKENLYANQIFVNEYATDSQSTPELQTVEMMDDNLMGQDQEIKKQYKSDIRTQFGVTDVFDSELEDAGGLNNEGLQLEVTDRTIAASQHDLATGPLDDLMKLLGFEDWRISFVPQRARDLDEMEQKLSIGERASKAGLEASWEDDDVSIDDGDFEAAEEPDAGGGLGGMFGGGGDEADDDGEGPQGSLFQQAAFKAGMPADEWLAQGDLYEVVNDDGRVSGVAVDMPESDVYVDWKRDEFDDPLDGAHVSVYSSIEDLEKATGNTAERTKDALVSKSGGGTDPFEKAEADLRAGFEHIVWSDAETKGQPFWGEDGDVPARVVDAVKRALDDDVLFDGIDGVSASDELREFFEEKLTQPQGWSTRSISNDLREKFGLDAGQADTVARTETASVLNNARGEVYDKMEEETGEQPVFKWIGPGNPDDGRTTEACEELKRRTDPRFGGEPVTMDKLVELEREVHEKHFPDLEFREHCIHPEERHTFTESFKLDHPSADSVEVEVETRPGTFEEVR